MRFHMFSLLAFVCALCACGATPRDPVESSERPQAAEGIIDPPASKQRQFVLPVTVIPQSDSRPHFGIDTSTLSEREAAVVKSAWENYQRVLAGKQPDCPATFFLSDGGSAMYDCDTYEIMRVKGIAGTPGKPGYEYGPSLDFLNGHTVERLRFVTIVELKRLESAP